MNINISKNTTSNKIQAAFDADIPSHHPLSYVKSRIDDGKVFVAETTDGNVAGFLIYNIWWGNCPFIELIKIKELYQRQGVGLELLNTAKQELKSMGFKTLISSTEVKNPLGLGFHDKANFKKLNSLNLPSGEEQFYTMDL